MSAPAGAPRDERFQLVGSLRNVSKFLCLAVTAMVVAFVAARAVMAATGADHGVRGFVVEGALLAVFGTVGMWALCARPIRRTLRTQARAVLISEARIQLDADRHRFAGEVQVALEMSDSEDDALSVTGRALGEATDRPAELLLADSSRAHVHRAAVSVIGGAAGCGVVTPWTCPAVRQGQTLAYGSSRSLSACPRLAERGTACSAVCLPVTVLGTPMGVIHVTAPEDAPLDAEVVVRLRTLAQQVGSRIGMLRAMASTQLQAATDPLTGALNRRSLEGRLRTIREHREAYAVVFADLDHFKDLNDTHGHETGDRALRLFADVLRSSVRAQDTVCRYGGEEFVLVLTGTDRHNAGRMMDAVRSRLEGALLQGDVPRVSASFGTADSTQAEAAEAVIRLADLAMFEAKAQGRDRVVVAEPPSPEQPAHPALVGVVEVVEPVVVAVEPAAGPGPARTISAPGGRR